MEVAVSGSRRAVERLQSLRSLGVSREFYGGVDVRGVVKRVEVCGAGFVDRGHESIYALQVWCGKKDKRMVGRLARVQELVEAQRDLILSSRRALAQRSADVIGSLEVEDSLEIGISDAVIDRIVQNVADFHMEVESLNAKKKKEKKKEKSRSSSSSSDSSGSALREAVAKLKLINAKGKRNKKGLSLSSSSSSSSSSESNFMDIGKAVDLRALRKNKKCAKQFGFPVAIDAPSNSSVSAIDSVSLVPVESTSQLNQVGEAMRSVIPSIASAERTAVGIAKLGSLSGDVQEQEPTIISQLRALCSASSTCTSTYPSPIYSPGPIELKDTPGGRVIVETASSFLPLVVDPAPTKANTSGKIEVCTVGKCRKGGSQQILASLQSIVPESSNISVTSCKCMGKCKNAPNVRVKNGERQSQLHSHVSVDDADTLFDFHFGLQPSGNQIPVLVASIDSDFSAAA